jgi:hypothetical protein
MKRGGVNIGEGYSGSAYTKPKPKEKILKVEQKILDTCEWKDGYVAKVFGTIVHGLTPGDKAKLIADAKLEGDTEWKNTEKLRELKASGGDVLTWIDGLIFPESQCTLKDGRPVHFSLYGGNSIVKLFYKEPVFDDDESVEDEEEIEPTPFRDQTNNKYFPGIIEALTVLRDKVKKMNEAGIFHNDMHRGNIVYDGKVARVIDFGFTEVAAPEKGDSRDVLAIGDYIKELTALESPPAPKGGTKKSRRKAVSSKRRTRKHRSFP